MPHLQDGPQLQVFDCLAQVQVGAQVQRLHLHFVVIVKLHSVCLWSSCDTVRAVLIIERSGYILANIPERKILLEHKYEQR